MSGGVPAITLPAGYLGSSFIGAALIACGFDINASKVACLVLAAFFLFTLWWARKNWLCALVLRRLLVRAGCTDGLGFCRTWLLILGMSGLIVLFWFVAGGVALRYFVSDLVARALLPAQHISSQVLFIGVMSDMYVLWDVVGTSRAIPLRDLSFIHSCQMIRSRER